MRQINEAGLNLIKAWEGIEDGDPSTVNLDPYLDPVNIWTIGWGHAIVHNGRFLKGAHNRALAYSLYPSGLTMEEAELLLRADVLTACRDVERLTHVHLTDNQFSALVSFVFNIGGANYRNSTVLRRLYDDDYDGVPEAMSWWNKGTVNGVKVVLPGLVNRRNAEIALWNTRD